MHWQGRSNPTIPCRPRSARPARRWSASKSFLLGLALTFFPIFDVPVFWPVLLMYFFILFFVTMKRQIKHMIKHKYIPLTWGKKVCAAARRCSGELQLQCGCCAAGGPPACLPALLHTHVCMCALACLRVLAGTRKKKICLPARLHSCLPTHDVPSAAPRCARPLLPSPAQKYTGKSIGVGQRTDRGN